MTRSGRDILIHRVIARLNVGGPAMHVVLLTREFEGRKNFRTRLIAGSVLESEGDMSYFAEEKGVEVTRLESMSRSLSFLDDLRSFFRLWRHFRRERPAIVHTHTAKAGALGRLAAALAGVPVRIHTYHGHVLGGDYFSRWKTGLFRGIERLLAIQTDRLIVLTDSQLRELSRDLGIARAEKFSVVPLGLELEPFARTLRSLPDARRRARRELDLDPDDIVVGIVGRLVPIKNHELLFDAVPILEEQLNERSEERLEDGELRVLVVGSGERKEGLEEHARSLGIQNRIHWLGWRDDLPEVYPAMDVLALPSKDEGTPVAVIEALAAGVPVVARDVGGVSEVLEGGKWGRLVQRKEDDEVGDGKVGEEVGGEKVGGRAGRKAGEQDGEEDAGATSETPAHRLARALADTITDPPPPETRAAASRSALERFGLDRLVADLEAIYLREVDG